MQSVRKHPGLFAAFSGILIFAWTAILSRSDSHVSVYILCGMAGILALSKNLPDLENCTLQGRAGEYGISLLFSAATVLANYPLFAPMSLLAVFTFCLCFSGGFLVFWNIFLFLSRKTFVQASPPASRPAPVFLIVFAAAALTDLLYLYTAAYPGVLTRDSVTTVQEILQGSYSSTMPFWHTMTVRVFLKTGMRLFGEINRAIVFFHTVQILFLSGCIAYAIVTLYRFSANRIFLVLCCGFFLLMPYHIVYSVTLWKDVPFSAAVLLFTTAFSCLLRKAPSAHFGTWALFILGGIGICLWRTNGWYAFLVSAIAILFLSKGRLRKPVVAMGIVLLLCWILNHPVLTALHVAAADPVEPLAVPFQQIARVLAEGRALSEEESSLLSQIFDLAKTAALYTPTTVDPVKFEALVPGSRSFLRKNLSACLKLYVSLGRKYLADYLKAWIDETKGYWNGGYSFWIYGTGVAENVCGIAASAPSSGFCKLFRALFRMLENCAIFQPLFSIGLFSWIVTGCYALNRRKKRETALLCLLPMILIVGLCLGSPVFAEFRYAYPVFLAAPLIVGLTCFTPECSEIPYRTPAAPAGSCRSPVPPCQIRRRNKRRFPRQNAAPAPLFSFWSPACRWIPPARKAV